jgi:hypothetical protein
LKVTALLLITLLITASPASAQTYVATTGSDATGTGTAGNPYRTIRFGVQQTAAGGTVLVAPGLYAETAETYIDRAMTLQKNGTGEVIIDAFNRDTVTGFKYMTGVVNASNVVIDGLNYRNCIGLGCKAIYVLGSGSNITIRNCSFNNLGWTSNNLTRLPPNNGTVANAIRVEGTGATPISNISILNNDIANCATGWGEALTITGNVNGFTIENNSVHDIANIGMVAAGNYSTGAPVAQNQARNGSIRRNEVYRCMSGIATSAGIYLDGALNCIVEANRCYQNGAGISVGAEVTMPGGVFVQGHNIRNNLVYENCIAGMFVGSATAGNVVGNSNFYNNTCYKNATGLPVNGIELIDGMPVAGIAAGAGGDVLLQNSNGITFQNNIIYPGLNRKALVGMSGRTATNFTGNYNVYFHDDATPLFFFASTHSFNGIAGPQTYNTISDFNTATGLDASSVFGNPGFSNAALYNFLPATGALCIDKGNPVYSAAVSGTTDIAGNTRIYNSIRTDAGAYEYQGTLYPVVTYTFTGNGNWNVPGNWSGNLVPPAILTSGSQIVINPAAAGECVLNVTQTLMPGASINVMSNKKFRVPGRLVQQ